MRTELVRSKGKGGRTDARVAAVMAGTTGLPPWRARARLLAREVGCVGFWSRVESVSILWAIRNAQDGPSPEPQSSLGGSPPTVRAAPARQ